MAHASSIGTRQLLYNSQALLLSWATAARTIHALPFSSGSTSAVYNHVGSSAHTQHQHANVEQQQQPQQQQQHSCRQGQPAPNWLLQLANTSRQERLSALSQLAFSMHGRAAELAGGGPWQALSAAAPLLPKAVTAAAAAAATAAAGPAGLSLASFQGSRYTGPSSLASPGNYWLRQIGMEDTKVTALLVAANAGCFGMQQLSTTFTTYCVRVGFKVAAGEYWRLLSAAFVHGNFLHFGINTLALWNMGRLVEPLLGSGPFLAVYLGSAVTGNWLGYWMSSAFSTSLGSSSALFGLLGAYLASSYVNRRSVYVSRAQVVSVLQTLGINMALMMFFGSHMDNWAHLGGFAGGAVIGAAIGPRYSR